MVAAPSSPSRLGFHHLAVPNGRAQIFREFFCLHRYQHFFPPPILVWQWLNTIVKKILVFFSVIWCLPIVLSPPGCRSLLKSFPFVAMGISHFTLNFSTTMKTCKWHRVSPGAVLGSVTEDVTQKLSLPPLHAGFGSHSHLLPPSGVLQVNKKTRGRAEMYSSNVWPSQKFTSRILKVSKIKNLFCMWTLSLENNR